MIPEGERIGLLAGRGAFPIHFALAAQHGGHPITALALEGFASPGLAEHVDEIHWLGVGQLDTLIRLCHERRIRHLAMAGTIEHSTVFQPGGKIEPRALRLLLRMQDRRAQSIFGALVAELSGEDIEVIESSYFLQDLIPGPGVLTPGRPPRPAEERDVAFAMPLARELARLDIGMSLVVKHGAVVAVEGMDGTDATIRRGGAIAGPGTVVVKASRPRQDFRFDLPIVGQQTVRTMIEAGTCALAFCAGETLFFDQAEALALAESSDIAVVALAAAPAPFLTEGAPRT